MDTKQATVVNSVKTTNDAVKTTNDAVKTEQPAVKHTYHYTGCIYTDNGMICSECDLYTTAESIYKAHKNFVGRIRAQYKTKYVFLPDTHKFVKITKEENSNV